MVGLWADGWFYISSAGLLISGVLFLFLLGQYRVASEAADVTEGDQGADPANTAVVRPVSIPVEAAATQVASHPLREPEPEPKPAGGSSEAVVYLQNIKGELTELHQEMLALASRVDKELAAVSARDKALIDRLGELTRAVENVKAAAPPATADEPAPAALAALEPEPVPEPKTEPALSPDETIRLELGSLIAAPPAQPEPKTPVTESTEQIPAPAQAEPVPEAPAPEEKPRRGPVWPV